MDNEDKSLSLSAKHVELGPSNKSTIIESGAKAKQIFLMGRPTSARRVNQESDKRYHKGEMEHVSLCSQVEEMETPNGFTVSGFQKMKIKNKNEPPALIEIQDSPIQKSKPKKLFGSIFHKAEPNSAKTPKIKKKGKLSPLPSGVNMSRFSVSPTVVKDKLPST